MKLTLNEAEVNHLRRLLAWAQSEFFLDENAHKGAANALEKLLEQGAIDEERAQREVAQRAQQMRQVPAYVRQGIRMLSKTVQTHDGKRGPVVDVPARKQGAIPGPSNAPPSAQKERD